VVLSPRPWAPKKINRLAPAICTFVHTALPEMPWVAAGKIVLQVTCW
jgi:hypothetical protein